MERPRSLWGSLRTGMGVLIMRPRFLSWVSNESSPLEPSVALHWRMKRPRTYDLPFENAGALN